MNIQFLLSAAFCFGLIVNDAAAWHVNTAACPKDPVEVAWVNYIDVSPCSEDPCSLQRGETYEMSISFETGPEPSDIPALTYHFWPIIHGIPYIPPGFNRTDACRKSGLRCPLGANTAYVYSTLLPVASTALPLDITVEVGLRDETTHIDLLCKRFQVKIV
eukprot:scpid92876/ scgid34958/ Epididymal secretory protein E1; 16.5 kDa secretory protein; Niemann Pick type C2 protein homolog